MGSGSWFGSVGVKVPFRTSGANHTGFPQAVSVVQVAYHVRHLLHFPGSCDPFSGWLHGEHAAVPGQPGDQVLVAGQAICFLLNKVLATDSELTVLAKRRHCKQQ